jgi:YD repeat-containing protein
MATQAEITQLYTTLLGRAPDPEGLAYWQSTGQTPAQIAQNIATSPEARGLLSSAPASRQVDLLYQDILARAPEAGGREYWEQQLASGKSVNEVKEAIRLSEENTIPNRPTFDDVFSRWNETHKKQFGTYLNLATATQKEVQEQIDRLIVDTKKEQADWDKSYGQTQEGRLIANNPPPNWYDIYNEWATNEYKPRFGTDTLNRAWNADADSVRQKDELDKRYLAALSEYNQKNGTNIQPDVGVLGAGAQPNAFYKEPEKAQKSFLQKIAPYAGAALAIAFPGAGTALGSAIGMGSGLAGAVAGNAIIGGTISGLAGQNIGQGALFGGIGGAVSQINWGAVSDSLAGTFADITGIDSAVIKSALAQPSSNAAFAAEDAFSMAQSGLGTSAIQQNLIASGMDSLTAATLANSAVMPGATAQSLLGSIANQPIYTNIGGLLSGGNAFATTKNVFDNLVAGGMSAADATQIINTAGGGLDLGTVGLDAAGNLISTAVGGAGSLLGGIGSAGGAAAAAGGAASTIGKTAAGILGGTAGQIGSGLLSSAVGIGGAMADRAALERYAQQIKDAANQYAPQQQFQPVGVTTRFGRTTTPQYDAQGRLTSIGVRGAEDVTTQQNRLLSLSGEALPTTTNIDQATQDYYNQLQAVQRPTDELNLAQIQNRLQATGRGGLAFGATSGAGGSNALMATNPELAAYYNALAQRQSTQALSAQDVAQQRLNAQISTSGTLFGQAKSIEEMIQQPLQLSSQFGQQATAGSTNVARSQLEANALAARLQSQGALGVNAAATGGAAGLAPGIGNILGTAIGNLF